MATGPARKSGKGTDLSALIFRFLYHFHAPQRSELVTRHVDKAGLDSSQSPLSELTRRS